jgi:hypothetical protein
VEEADVSARAETTKQGFRAAWAADLVAATNGNRKNAGVIAPGPQGMGLVPSLFTADPKEEIRLNTNSVSLVSKTDDSVKMKYIEATTGIKVPEKKLILG